MKSPAGLKRRGYRRCRDSLRSRGSAPYAKLDADATDEGHSTCETHGATLFGTAPAADAR